MRSDSTGTGPLGNSANFMGVVESLEIGDTTLHVDTAGTGQPVLFLHAGVTDSRMWNAQFEGIEGYRLIRFDMRGYGRSRLGTQGFTNHDDTVTVLDHLGIERAVLVGCSIGANTALQVAAAAPERVDGLVLVGADSPGFDPEIDYQSPEWPEAVAAFETGDLDRVAELEAEMWLAGTGRTITDLPTETVALFIDMDLIALRNEAARDRLDRGQQLQSLPHVDIKVEVVVGALDIPPLVAAAHHLAANLGDGAPTVIGDTAHLPPMDRPGEFNDLLMVFLHSL